MAHWMCLRHMGKANYPIIAIALASTLVAPPLSAFAQRESDLRGTLAPHKGVVQTAPHRAVQPAPQRTTPAAVRSHNFRGHVYHGQLAWKDGRWRHEKRKGRFGWWWDVGGIWYFYPEPIEGPPDYVSDIEVADEAAAAPPPPPEEPRQTFYYRPGDLKGIPYDTIEECTKARQQAGDVGVCVMK
jgi:hypothetical protein